MLFLESHQIRCHCEVLSYHHPQHWEDLHYIGQQSLVLVLVVCLFYIELLFCEQIVNKSLSNLPGK